MDIHLGNVLGVWRISYLSFNFSDDIYVMTLTIYNIILLYIIYIIVIVHLVGLQLCQPSLFVLSLSSLLSQSKSIKNIAGIS